MHSHRPPTRRFGLSAGVLLAIAALAVPPLVAAADVTVNAIPGGGWVQALDNNAADAVIAESPEAGLGDDSVELAMAANSDFVGISRPIVQPLSDLTGGSWMTFVTGDSGAINTEPASLRFAMFQDGGSGFTTLVFERLYNDTVLPDVWQETTFDGDFIVWQTDDDNGFCDDTAAGFCTLDEFKANYDNANITGLTVAIGSGVPATTSYVDGVSLTIDDATDTWDFELAAAPTAAPTAPGSGAGPATAPPTDIGAAATPGGLDGRELIIVGGLIVLALVSVRLRPARPPR